MNYCNDRTKRFHTDDDDMQKVLTKELLYHKIVKAEQTGDQSAIITLDNGKQLSFYGNEGCGGCENGWYYLEKFIDHIPDNAITNVRYMNEGDSTFSVNIFFENEELNLVTYEGGDNGYYGTGFELFVSEIN